jgi:hypothetical protein
MEAFGTPGRPASAPAQHPAEFAGVLPLRRERAGAWRRRKGAAAATCRHATVAVGRVCVGRNEGEDEEGLKE